MLPAEGEARAAPQNEGGIVFVHVFAFFPHHMRGHRTGQGRAGLGLGFLSAENLAAPAVELSLARKYNSSRRACFRELWQSKGFSSHVL